MKNNLIFEKKISTHAGIIILLVLSLLVGWFTIRTGEKIVDNTPQSKIYDSQRNAQQMLDGKLK